MGQAADDLIDGSFDDYDASEDRKGVCIDCGEIVPDIDARFSNGMRFCTLCI